MRKSQSITLMQNCSSARLKIRIDDTSLSYKMIEEAVKQRRERTNLLSLSTLGVKAAASFLQASDIECV
jgi:hypothetical protein